MKTTNIFYRAMCLVLMALCSVFASGQSKSSMQNINIKSPEVAAFTRIGEIPVSLYTGVPHISIPLYEVKNGNLSLPITLDYQATAVKVNQEATWVGLNWLLNAGGVITTRTTRPEAGNYKNDWNFLYNEMGFTTVGMDGLLGHYYKMDGNHENGWRGSYGHNRFRCVSRDNSEIPYELYAKILDNHEGESQAYSANFMGHSFDFVYHPLKDEFIIIGKEQKYKITGGSTGVSKITDAAGIEYSFDIIESNAPEAYTNAPYTTRSVSFYLTKVKHPDGRTINLKYQKPGFIRMLPEVLENWTYNLTDKPNCFVEKKLSDLVKINNYYLSEISTDEVSVLFNLSSRTDLRGAHKLDNIVVKDRKGNLVKSFKFGYNYVEGTQVGGNRLYEYYEERNLLGGYNSLYSDDEINTRLMLVSLQEESDSATVAESTLPPYRFAYFTGLPGKSSSAQDYWGYYNGTDNGTLLTGRSLDGESGYNDFPYEPTPSVPEGDRRTNPNTIYAGMLNTITYPTGGTTTFSYEPHSFSNYTYLYKGIDTFPSALNIGTKSTNVNATIPSQYTEPKDFTLIMGTEMNVTVKHICPTGLYWIDMMGSPAQLFSYKTIYTQNGPVETMTPVRIWTVSPADTIGVSGTQIKKEERIFLPPGKYRIQALISSPQTTPGANFPGERSVEINLKSTNTRISQGAGVRIKSITQQDNNGNVHSTTYRYEKENGSSSGILMAPIRYARKKLQVNQEPLYVFDTPVGPSESTPPTAVLKEYWTISSLNMACPPVGGPVGYSRVVVDHAKGTEVYEFHNEKRTLPMFDFYPQPYNPLNGNLLRKKVYSDTGKMLKETENTYTILKKEHHFINAIVEDIHYGNEECSSLTYTNPYALSCSGGRMMFCIYPSSKYWIEQTMQVVNDYVGNDTIVTVHHYTYNPNNLQPAKTETVYGTNHSEAVYTIYATDYQSAGTYPNPLIDGHILNLPTEQIRTVTKDNVTSVIEGNLYKYSNEGLMESHSLLELPSPLDINSFRFSNKQTAGVLGTDTLGNSLYSPSSDYYADKAYTYHSSGNVATVTENARFTTVYLWSYGQQYPIAEITGTTLTEVMDALGYSSAQELDSLEALQDPDVKAVRQKLENHFRDTTVQITTYTWKPLYGITSTTAPNGNVTYYSYDGFGRLEKITDNDMNVKQQFEYHYK